MNNTVNQLGTLEQAAILGRGCAVDIFVKSLNPKSRTKDFEWDSLVRIAGDTASKEVAALASRERWEGAKRAVVEVAACEAQTQMQEMLDMSGVNEWLDNGE